MQARDTVRMVARLFAACVLLLASIGNAAAQGKRVALVVGNGAYKSVTPLTNPTNDARLIAKTLASLGFTLIGGGARINLDKAGFDQAVRAFGEALPGAEVALFYYAGHGLQVEGVNYLVPIDASPTRPQDLDFQMVDANVVLHQMEGSGTRLNLVILDACRNNPFGGRGLARAAAGGLAQMRAPDGTLISYATQPGNVASDGAGADSPYSTALAETLRKPGLDVFRLFNQVGLTVKRVTGGVQEPWVSTSPIDGDFYFAGAGSAPPVASQPAPTTPPPAKTASLPEPRPTPQPPWWWQVRLDYQSYDGEGQNYGVAPIAAIRTSNYEAPTPLQVIGARTITTPQLRDLLASPQPPLLIDVLGGTPTVSLPGAIWLDWAGLGNGPYDTVQTRLTSALGQLTQGDRARPMVFFCLSKTCWLSHNAAVRAVALGYGNVLWYRGGRNAWMAAGLPMEPVRAGQF